MSSPEARATARAGTTSAESSAERALSLAGRQVVVLLIAAVLTLGPVSGRSGPPGPSCRRLGQREFGLTASCDVFKQLNIVLLVVNSALVTGSSPSAR